MALSALLHLGVLGWLFHGLAEAGGAPSLGDGGDSFEIVMVASAAGGSESGPEAQDASSAPPPAPKPGPEAEQYLAAAAQARATAEAEAAIAAAPPPPPPPAPAPPTVEAAPEPPTPDPLPEAVEGPPVPLGDEQMVPPTAPLAPAEPPLPEALSITVAEPEPAPAEPPPPVEEVELQEPIEPIDEPLSAEEALPMEEPLPEAPAAQAPLLAKAPLEEAPLQQVAEAPTPEPVDPVEPANPANEATAPPLKPTKEIALPEPVKQAAPAKQKTAAKQQLAEAEPSEPGQANTELAALPSPGSNAAASTDGGSSDPGSPGAPQVGVSPGELQDYGQLLAAWLDRHKRYPDQARKRRQEGVVTVELAIDGQGHMVSHRIVDDSGVAALDQEAYALLERANPFPLPPGGGTHSFQVPIVFSLR